MNALTETQPQSPSNGLSAAMSSLTLELAKCLKLVAPISMSADAQMVWLQAAVDALDGIHAHEVAAVSAELRRSVTRPSQIVPAIAELIAARRKGPQPGSPIDPICAAAKREQDIAAEGLRRRQAANGDRQRISDAWEWERETRIEAGLSVSPRPKPFTQAELDRMSPQIASLGIKCGFLRREGGRLIEA